MAIVKRRYGTGYSYTLDGVWAPGVTTIIRETLPAPALIRWAAETVAGEAINYWDELAEMMPSERYKRLAGAPNRDRDKAANRGTEVHRLAAALVAGDEVDKPDELAGHIESYVSFLNTLEPEALLVEGVVANRSVGYCGTLDLVCEVKREPYEGRWLLDLKTSRSGIFREALFQAVFYAHAEVFLDVDGTERPMGALGIERVGAVHVRADGWDLHEFDWGPRPWRTCRNLAATYADLGECDTWLGRS